MANNQTGRPSDTAAARKRPAGAQNRGPSSKAAAQEKRRRAQRRRFRRVFALILVLLAAGIYITVNLLKDDYQLENENDPVATITLEGGERIIVELFPSAAPETVASFIELAASGYYDGQSFSKIVPGERVQLSGGAQTPLLHGEFRLNGVENPLSHTRGTLSMARLTGYDTADGRFFICLGDQSYFDGAYAAFGRVVKGMEAVDKIASAPTDALGAPVNAQRIKSVKVETNK